MALLQKGIYWKKHWNSWADYQKRGSFKTLEKDMRWEYYKKSFGKKKMRFKKRLDRFNYEQL